MVALFGVSTPEWLGSIGNKFPTKKHEAPARAACNLQRMLPLVEATPPPPQACECQRTVHAPNTHTHLLRVALLRHGYLYLTKIYAITIGGDDALWGTRRDRDGEWGE